MPENPPALHEAAAKGFAAGVDSYARGRPDYPRASLDCLAKELRLAPSSKVIDLGAGTGKLTAALSEISGARITAVEPVEEMRRKCAALHPDLEIVPGTAEKLPFADASLDSVLVAQAFHWFRAEQAVAEIGRVLKPGGGLGMIWNVRDEGTPWVAALTNLIDPLEKGAPRYKTGSWRKPFETADSPFSPLQCANFAHEQRTTREGVVDRVASISFIAALPLEEKEKVRKQVRALLEGDPSLQGKVDFVFPYRTDVFWCRKNK
jgi:SAM-dependent methyltransferase